MNTIIPEETGTIHFEFGIPAFLRKLMAILGLGFTLLFLNALWGYLSLLVQLGELFYPPFISLGVFGVAAITTLYLSGSQQKVMSSFQNLIIYKGPYIWLGWRVRKIIISKEDYDKFEIVTVKRQYRTEFHIHLKLKNSKVHFIGCFSTEEQASDKLKTIQKELRWN